MIDAVWIFVRAIAILLTCVSLIGNGAAPVLQSQKEIAPKEIWIGDVLSRDNRLRYGPYVLEKRQRKVRYDYPREARAPSSWVDISFAVLKRRGKVLARFDDDIYFGMGNDTRFGLFSFLGGPTKQIVISQDIFRGGTQWVVSLSPRYRIIFNGPNWGVGREGDDMGIIDLDHDGVYEITLPITDFYDFQDKLPIARIPLPEIIFKYDARAMRYFPANPMVESYELRGMNDLEVEKSTDEFDQRATALKKLLAFVYLGKEKEAWNFYEKSYNLSDKGEIRRRVRAILIRQPVYKFIYRNRRKKKQTVEVALPENMRLALNRRFPGWKYADVDEEIRKFLNEEISAFARPDLISGDFDGNGKLDYAVLIEHKRSRTGDWRAHLVIFLAKRDGFNTHVLKAEGAYLCLARKGEWDYDYETQSYFTYATDGIFAGIFEKGGTSYIYKNGKFHAIVTSD